MSKPETLRELRRALVRFEIQMPTDVRAKKEIIRQRFGLSASAYQRKLTEAIEDPSIIADYPTECRRIRHRLDIDSARGSE